MIRKTRVRRLGQRLIVFVHAQLTISVLVSRLEHILNRRFGDLADSPVQLVGAQLAVLVAVGDHEQRLYSRLYGLAQLGPFDLLIVVGVE